MDVATAIGGAVGIEGKRLVLRVQKGVVHGAVKLAALAVLGEIDLGPVESLALAPLLEKWMVERLGWRKII